MVLGLDLMTRIEKQVFPKMTLACYQKNEQIADTWHSWSVCLNGRFMSFHLAWAKRPFGLAKIDALLNVNMFHDKLNI